MLLVLIEFRACNFFLGGGGKIHFYVGFVQCIKVIYDYFINIKKNCLFCYDKMPGILQILCRHKEWKFPTFISWEMIVCIILVWGSGILFSVVYGYLSRYYVVGQSTLKVYVSIGNQSFKAFKTYIYGAGQVIIAPFFMQFFPLVLLFFHIFFLRLIFIFF